MLQRYYSTLLSDLHSLWDEFSRDFHRDDLLWITVVTLVGLGYRLFDILNPITYDEAYTYISFVRYSLWQTVSDYHLPNNHILLSVILNIWTRVFGAQRGALRTPTLLVGLLLISAVYLLAKRLYSTQTAFLASLLVAVFPTLIHFSVVARGYIFVATFTILLFILGDYVIDHKNRLAWTFISLLSALGFFAVPTMLFPFSALYIWLLLSWVWRDTGSEYRSRGEFIVYCVISGLFAAGGTILLYAPILIRTPEALLYNRFVAPLPWDIFPERMLGKALNTWYEWTSGFPAWLSYLGLASIVVSWLFHKSFSRRKIALQWAFLVGILLIVLLRRPNAWPRVWSFLVAPGLLWASAGFVEPVRKISSLTQTRYSPGLVLNSLAFGAAIVGLLHTLPSLPAHWQHRTNLEAIATQIGPLIENGDTLVLSPKYTPQLLYYLDMEEAPTVQVRDVTHAQKAFIIVFPKDGETLDKVVSRYIPSSYRSLILNSATLIDREGPIEVYLSSLEK
ncbi:MAG: hypothetical protein D6770_08640 [Anaerolineae bacterium]|nr:MAG: hypothetical protein D6770_08640 [Anaerolineae bacterium]